METKELPTPFARELRVEKQRARVRVKERGEVRAKSRANMRGKGRAKVRAKVRAKGRARRMHQTDAPDVRVR
jgi:hypothetical protein